MRKISDFEKKYPLFVPYVIDETMKSNMLLNEDLLRKYNEHLSEISEFVKEIASRFDVETVLSLLQETVFKCPDEVLLSFIKAYLNSSEASKNNRDVMKFYNKSLHLGEECVHYIEEHGIITNRQYRDLPVMAVDEQYNKYKQDNEIFKNEILSHVYPNLTLTERRLVVSLLAKKSFGMLNNLFASVDIPLRQLLALIAIKGIDGEIINQDVANNMGEYNLLCLLFAIFDLDYSDVIVVNIRHLIREGRYGLLTTLALNKGIPSLSAYNADIIRTMSDEDFIEDITKKGFNKVKKDE